MSQCQAPAEYQAEPERKRSDGVTIRGVLIATALTLCAGIVLRAGGVGAERTAIADMVGDSGSYHAMTTQSGADELLYVIDDRTEHLLVYRVQNANSVLLSERQDLRALFSTARAAYLGSAPGRGRP